MRKSSFACAVLAGAAVLAAPVTASASVASVSSVSGTQTVSFRGLNLTIPANWKVYRKTDAVKVVTGACRAPSAAYFTPRCDAFWLFGPKVLKYGHEGFSAYNSDQPFYPAGDVEPCPFDGKYGQVLGKATVVGLRQVGSGHRADYRSWAGRCVKYRNGEQTATFAQREWYLPKSKILIVDVWKTPGLAGLLKHATWS